MARYEIKTDRRLKERRQEKLLSKIKLWFIPEKERRYYQRRMPKFAAVNHTTGHYVVYK